MGQTLNHGVYLPAEGERNCYSGLASNWNLLDTAIGDIAGKASATHTHGNITNDGKVGTDANKPLITGTGGAVQAGSFGTAANTFCEGNDSRLSDARTPVAHTHTKSDVTDLLNSNFIPSANNSYDLGSSSYQWKSVYAQSYYYNGTPWGLDKQNEWTNFQRMTSNPAVWYLRNNTVTLGTAPASNRYIGMFFEDVNGANLGYAAFQANRNGYNSIVFNLINSDGTNTYTGGFRCTASPAGAYSFFPETSECDLGISTNRWKTFNGVNPGALSLPDYAHPTSLDVSAQGLNWHTDTTPNFYEVPANGYFAVIVQCPTVSNGVLDIFVNYTGIGSSDHGTYAGNDLFCYVPVIKGQTVRVRARCDNYYSVTFYPCMGNV